MPNLTYAFMGIPKSTQKIVPGDTATKIGANVLAYTQHIITYTSGGTTELVAGMTVVGATSAATADVVSVTLASGTWGAGTAAGTITIRGSVGTWTSGENIFTDGGSNDATMTGTPATDTTVYPYKGSTAKAAIVQATGNNGLMTMDGSTPDQTYDKGHLMPANTAFQLIGPETLRNLTFIDAVSGNASVINLTLFWGGKWEGTL